jgi:hypothetical protein
MLSETNKMQRNTILFIAVKAPHISGGFPAHHQEPKNCTCSIWYMSSLIAAAASVVEMELLSTSTTLAVAAVKLGKYQTLCVQFLGS